MRSIYLCFAKENVRPIAPVGSEVAGGLKSVPTILVNPAQSKTRLKVNIKYVGELLSGLDIIAEFGKVF